ncbi:hypothetical protein RJ640_024512 [Escallonia rubra]|uniref:PROP1-like PPR domain-containing protein n=1 Tax=Escallonia rubra TaxID=112253 RepID=A0AA88URT1_9ASTE|nr:hypothetical protein RJ640_024512 [Escallonia rubra]
MIGEFTGMSRLGSQKFVIYDARTEKKSRPDPIALGELGQVLSEIRDNEGGIKFMLQEIKSRGFQPDLVMYNTLFQSLAKAEKPCLARGLYENMAGSGVVADEKTLTTLAKTYGKAGWACNAMEMWEGMKSNGWWPIDFGLYNTLLSMCADLGMEEEAKTLFEDMKVSKYCKPDSWSYTAVLNIYSSGGNANKAMALFEEMCTVGVKFNSLGSTALIQCLGKAQRVDDLVKVYEVSSQKGVEPDDGLSRSLLTVLSQCKGEDANKVISCLKQANPKLVSFVKLVEEEKTGFETIDKEFKGILEDVAVEARRSFCNCLMDICRNRDLQDRAHELHYMGTDYGLYPGLTTTCGLFETINAKRACKA